MNNKPIILFDGVCNLCNTSVQFVIKHDKRAFFTFASLQGETGQRLLKKYGLTAEDLNSFVLIINNKALTRSAAALTVARNLGGIIKLLYGFMIIPAFIRDGMYNIIAKNRYKWFGKRDSCMIPSPELSSRFLH